MRSLLRQEERDRRLSLQHFFCALARVVVLQVLIAIIAVACFASARVGRPNVSLLVLLIFVVSALCVQPRRDCVVFLAFWLVFGDLLRLGRRFQQFDLAAHLSCVRCHLRLRKAYFLASCIFATRDARLRAG